ncbi:MULTISPECIES: IS110 family transposase [Ramlibacter]|uniref:IS110 family transposase n=1 Tax=Ramlibacter pinisoli TaxID=2682844 RepID=A0A6N8IYT5_9BURK|nr:MULTISPECIES: IS110 family transposase [Ramlibacter]MBA2961804.1 IS110 family transposase [Ramlibacter sp. CGMCC 1.13660]MVQ31745.1 IS110 family transposase [Ramlibacter pinisoli]
MNECAAARVVRVGVDLSKRVYQVHAVDRSGEVVFAKPMSPERFLAWCADLPVGCLVATEACGGAHHIARRMLAMGLDARLIAAHFVAPYRLAGKSGKNDANDAAAICEAASRPHMHFVPVKTTERQGQVALHRLREGYKEERSACINRIRGLLTEFGLVFPKRPETLRRVLIEVLEDGSNELPGLVRLALERAHAHWVELDAQLAWCDQQIDVHVRTDVRAKKALQLQGIGPITASAIIAGVGDFTQFRNARQFGAWLGLVPSQNSSGGKVSLGGITKRGDDYLRTLLIQGAKAAVMTANKRTDRLSRWLLQLKARAGWQKATVALANKNARVLWTIMTHGTTFDADYLPQIPAARQPKPPAAQLA